MVVSLDKNLEENEIPEIKFRNGDASEEIKSIIIESLKKIESNSTLLEICKLVKNELEVKYSKGWIIFIGKYIVGVFIHINGTLCELEYNDNIFIIFKSLYPIS